MNATEQSNSRVTNTGKINSSQMGNSIIMELEDPKNSRIINRKQI